MEDYLNCLENVFENAGLCCFIFKKDGRIFWKSSKAYQLFPAISNFSEIEEYNGKCSVSNGIVTFKGEISPINESGLYAVTFKDDLSDKYRNSIISYIDNCDAILRITASSISSSLAILNESTELKNFSSSGPYLDSIMKNCCNLMRIQNYNNEIKAFLNSDCDKTEICELNAVLDEFCDESQEYLKNRCIIKFIKADAKEYDPLVKLNKNHFIFLLLSLIRILLKCNPHLIEFKIDEILSFDKKNAKIKVSIDSPFNFNEESITSENFIQLAYADALNVIIKPITDSNAIEITIPVSNDGKLQFRSATQNNDYKDTFTPYAIMLADLSDERLFY